MRTLIRLAAFVAARLAIFLSVAAWCATQATQFEMIGPWGTYRHFHATLRPEGLDFKVAVCSSMWMNWTSTVENGQSPSGQDFVGDQKWSWIKRPIPGFAYDQTQGFSIRHSLFIAISIFIYAVLLWMYLAPTVPQADT